MDLSRFHCITVISNPIRYKSRYALYEKFAKAIEAEGAKLWTVELQTGERIHKITQKENPFHIQVSTSSLPGEVWHKENLLNIGIQHALRAFPDGKYFATLDADILFEPGWLAETQHALQHWDVVQMWSHAVDLGPNNQMVGNPHRSFMFCHWHDIPTFDKSGYTIGGHPGFAWAWRRDALNKLGAFAAGGPLLDWGVLGSADRHMACALIGKVDQSVHGKTHWNYRKWLRLWQARAEKNIRHNVGYVPGTIRHLWHGRKSQRGYATRWQILVKYQFNPETDLRRDVFGIWNLVSETPRQMALRDEIRKYFRARNEDSIDME